MERKAIQVVSGYIFAKVHMLTLEIKTSCTLHLEKSQEQKVSRLSNPQTEMIPLASRLSPTIEGN